jgi:hypothetical protein
MLHKSKVLQALDKANSFHDKKPTFSARHLTILRFDIYKDPDHKRSTHLQAGSGTYFPGWLLENFRQEALCTCIFQKYKVRSAHLIGQKVG